MKLRLCVLALALIAGGCAGRPRPADPSDTQLDQQKIHLDLVRGMIAQNQYYAALAHIQEQRNRGYDDNQLRLLEAESQRQLKRYADAERNYRLLLLTPLAAEAYHGLGLLFAGRDLNQSIANLRRAVQKQPASSAMRNDLGYALMLAGRYPEALPELATAAELAPDQVQNTNNLIMLLVLMNDEASVKRVAADAGIRSDQLAQLRERALSLKPTVKNARG
jgi:Flp pilus assembly protein TadD